MKNAKWSRVPPARSLSSQSPQPSPQMTLQLQSHLRPSASPAWLRESSSAGFPLCWAHQETWMWERSRFPPYHFSTRCLSHNKDVLSWGFAKPVVIINLLLSIEWLVRQRHGKSATWPPLGHARKWEKFGDVSFFILHIKMTVGGDRSEAQHGWSCVLERMFQGLLSEMLVREGWLSQQCWTKSGLFIQKHFPFGQGRVQEFKLMYPFLQAVRISDLDCSFGIKHTKIQTKITLIAELAAVLGAVNTHFLTLLFFPFLL